MRAMAMLIALLGLQISPAAAGAREDLKELALGLDGRRPALGPDIGPAREIRAEDASAGKPALGTPGAPAEMERLRQWAASSRSKAMAVSDRPQTQAAEGRAFLSQAVRSMAIYAQQSKLSLASMILEDAAARISRGHFYAEEAAAEGLAALDALAVIPQAPLACEPRAWMGAWAQAAGANARTLPVTGKATAAARRAYLGQTLRSMAIAADACGLAPIARVARQAAIRVNGAHFYAEEGVAEGLAAIDAVRFLGEAAP